MNKFTKYAIVSGAALALAACGSSDDAATEAEADTVEMPADAAMADVVDEPVVDDTDVAPVNTAPSARAEPVDTTTATEREEASARAAADNARDVAREAMEAADAAEAATRNLTE